MDQVSHDPAPDVTSSDARRTVRRFVAVVSAFLLLMAWAVVARKGTALAQKKDSCVECHGDLEGNLGEPVSLFNDDIHRERGLSCTGCHGGDASQDDASIAMSPARGFVGKPSPESIPAFCGKCHSNAEFMRGFAPALRVDQESEYYTSVHGKLLKTGDRNVATCISCHGVHGIRAVRDPASRVYPLNVSETCASCHSNPEHMQKYGIPTDQYEKYKRSVHAKALFERQDLTAPTCNDCHGNHGAAPPGVAAVSFVCGQCHVRQASLFRESPHKPVFDALEVGECAECHGNHDIPVPTDAMLGTQEGSVCTTCHVEGDAGYETAQAMRNSLEELTRRIEGARDILDRGERAGMEVSRPRFELAEAVDSLTNARVLIHGFSREEFDKVVGSGLDIAANSHGAGVAALDELSFRRKGLGVSLFFILFLAALIYLKLRQIERRQQSPR